MKKILKVVDKDGHFIKICLLEKNDKVRQDIIYLCYQTKDGSQSFAMTPDEALYIAMGLNKAVCEATAEGRVRLEL